MADLTTQPVMLDGRWKNMTAAMSLTDGETYILSAESKRGTEQVVRHAYTDDSNPPSDGITGHMWFSSSIQEGYDPREYTQDDSTTLWMRCEGGTTEITASVT